MTKKSDSERDASVPTEHIESSIQKEKKIVDEIKNHYKSQKDKPFPTTIHCYRVLKLIGCGAFGKVALAVHKLANREVAIKRIEKSNLQKDQIERILAEVRLMSAIRHRHVIKLLEVFETNKYLFMVLEYAEGGDLLQHINKVKAMTEDEAKPLFKQIVYSIAHCHCRSVLHRDIKLENILIGENGDAKLCDFGISQLVDDPKQIVYDKSGTPPYMPPESFSEQGYSGFMSDIWSLGVLLYTMVCGKMPFCSDNLAILE